MKMKSFAIKFSRNELLINVMEKLKGHYRRHRFNSLAALEAADRGEQDPLQQGYDTGFSQGQERGLEQGLEEGRAQGEAAGYQAGYQAGLAQGEAAGRQAFLAAMEPLAQIQQQMEELHQEALNEHTDHLCALVEQVARRVIHAELSLNPDQLKTLVEEALGRMDTRKGDVTIFVSPDDYQRLTQTGTNSIAGYPIQADATLAVGDCRLESEQQQQTVSSEERLQGCVSKVREELMNGRAPSADPAPQESAPEDDAAQPSAPAEHWGQA
jgi:flagellar assembly protein FliH